MPTKAFSQTSQNTAVSLCDTEFYIRAQLSALLENAVFQKLKAEVRKMSSTCLWSLYFQLSFLYSCYVVIVFSIKVNKIGNMCSALLVAGPGGTELQQPHLCWAPEVSN